MAAASAQSNIRIVLADDHEVVRHGLVAVLGDEPGLQIVAVVSSGQEAVEAVRELKPDVAVVDIAMPDMNGIEACRLIREASPDTRVVFLSMHSNEAYFLEAFKAGAHAYVVKDVSSSELVLAIRKAVEGERHIAASFDKEQMAGIWAKIDSGTSDSYHTLTRREKEILKLASEGLGNKDISKILFISPRTVEIHRGHIMRKLGLKNRSALLKYALNRGIIDAGR